MITVRNDYHNTEVRIKANIGDTLSESQVRRAKRELCGISGCMCGGALGQRGPQEGIAFDVSMDRDWRQIVRVIGDAALSTSFEQRCEEPGREVIKPEEESDAMMLMPPNKPTESELNGSIVSDGSTASYYELPAWARELQDLIRFKGMNGAQAEIFRAIYRGDKASHSGQKRQAKKVLAYAIDEVVRTHSPGQSFGPIRDAVFAVIHSLLEAGEHHEV